MDGRTSLSILLLALLLPTSGCLPSWNTKKDVSQLGTASSTTFTNVPADMSKVKKAEPGPKRNPQPKTEILFGEMKEGEADSESGKANPEIQARLRDEARQAYQHALKIDPNNLEAQRHLGRLYAKTGDYERAFDIYKKAMAKHPKEAGLWCDLGHCHKRRKDLGQAAQCFAKASELDPENPEYHKMLGFALAVMGRVDEALPHLTRAQGLAMAHCTIARALIERDDKQRARQHVTIALRENRDLALAQNLQGWLDGPPRPISALGAPQ